MSATSIYGFDTQFGQHCAVGRQNAFPVNSTVTEYLLTVPVGFGSIRIARIEWVASAALSDADGTMLVSVLAYDASEATSDTLVNGASVEGGTAHVPTAFALASESSEKEFTLDEGDSLRVTYTNNSAAIDTNGAIAVNVYYHSIPRENAGTDIKHAGNYR